MISHSHSQYVIGSLPSLNLVYGRRVHWGGLFPEHYQGFWGAPKYEKFTLQSKLRHLQNGVDGKAFDQRSSNSAVVLCPIMPTSHKDCLKNSRRPKCTLVNFSHRQSHFACLRISTICKPQRSTNRLLWWKTFAEGEHQPHRMGHASRDWEQQTTEIHLSGYLMQKE